MILIITSIVIYALILKAGLHTVKLNMCYRGVSMENREEDNIWRGEKHQQQYQQSIEL